MRFDKRDPREIYEDFWDWLRRDGHPAFIAAILIGYVVYLNTTEEA